MPLEGGRGEPTTPASARRCPRSSCCSSAARGWCSARTWGGRRGASPRPRSRPASRAAGRADRRAGAPGARGGRARGAARRPSGSSRARCWCSRTRAGSRARPRTTPTLARRAGRAGRRLRERRLRRRPPRARLHRRGGRAPGPAAAGLLLEREVTTLRAIVEAPERPLVVVLGGAKVTDKVALIDRFLDIADALLIGGAMCFSFFRAQGKPTGDSLVEEEGVELARAGAGQGRGAATAGCCCRWTSCSATASTPTPSAASSTAPRCPTAGWASTWARAPPRPTPSEIAARRHRVLERPDGGVRDGAVRGRHARAWPRRWPRRRARRWWAAATRPRRWRSSAWPTGWTTCRPAAARRSSCSRAGRCPGVEALDDA